MEITGFFTCDILDTFKDDIASMEHPIFSLSKEADYRVLIYEKNGITIKIQPSYNGLATIHDKDILLYLGSLLMNAKNKGLPISREIKFTIYDYIVATKKKLGGEQYKQLKAGLGRLNGTLIETNIKTNDKEVTKEFGLIESWETIKENSGFTSIKVTLSDWFYNSILGDSVLTINADYFQLRKPMERRLYELGRKYCGHQNEWKIGLENLQIKMGTILPYRKFKFSLKAIAKDNRLPDYEIELKGNFFYFRNKIKQVNLPEKTSKIKKISKKEIEKQARPGESYQDVSDRIKALKNALI